MRPREAARATGWSRTWTILRTLARGRRTTIRGLARETGRSQGTSSWILGFGSGVRVLAPASLVDWAAEELDSARSLYPDGSAWRPDSSIQPALPFGTLGLLSA